MKTFSPAKINLTLEILGKRSDGFHELATWMLPVGLYDSIEIEEASHPSFISNVPELEGDPSNLVLRAARSFTQAALIDTAHAIRLQKRIPIGAGLGGGSSNAAVTLQLLNKLHGFPLRGEQLEELAANLGSDVAFFLDGRSAWCTGRGERIEARLFPDHLWICLFKPGFAVPTAGAYHAYARLAENLKRGKESVTPWGKLRNDLEPAVLPKYLFLALLKDWLNEQSEPLFALMAGSGSTVFAIVQSQPEGETLRARFREQFGKWTWSVVCRLNPTVAPEA
ncbi:MAG TPA: 4-(cytidine 5'-diphospho)-2-C-methyl-D-erythritol kinase [Chthoniobacterales bacterium]|jgi:4-diphosphocytidyl-2-C-methyl-D-erythritol kinase|nr:4-(cytidine 5'-diphospho)-2-C-methyl-D-erythritol kinase [Chthoniobacterales bacterium]